jgi:hypothetical protein
MRRSAAFAIVLSVCCAITPLAAHAQPAPGFMPGAPGLGDPYFPLDGNGGYDIKHTRLELTYDPTTDGLAGVATITARATQNLSAFNLDFVGLTVRSITVDGRTATWSRAEGELTVTPARGIVDRQRFITVVSYDGSPQTLPDQSGFFHTDDGALVLGQPDGAATWFPANDHPLDKSKFTFVITAPTGLEVLANGILQGQTDLPTGWTTWTWDATEPMAPYLAMMAIGEFAVNAYQAGGLPYWDAIDPDLLPRVAPRTGTRFALSQAVDLSYKRLARTIDVPAGGAQVSFWINRDTEASWDFVFVEAHPAGSDDWTTLPDENGHTSESTGNPCPFWLELHPFLTHYQTDNGDDTCSSTGTTGEWWAATGRSNAYENWVVDLSGYEGAVEVSISYASDDVVQGPGVFVDDIVVSTGEGSTSFEDDGDTLDGWTVPGAPEGSEPNGNDWIVGTVDDAPPSIGEVANGSLARQPEIVEFLESVFGPYPFSTAGGIVDDEQRLGFALETQTRPIYATGFFGNSIDGDSVVVHELAHQWVGDSLAVEAWQHIWLNEGFASYAEWLWSEEDGLATAQEIYEFYTTIIPADDPFWTVTIGDPGTADLFDIAVYFRGAMTLHALRQEVGDTDFFRILRRWVINQSGGNVTTDEFIAVAEGISGQQLDDLFLTWLFTPEKPAGLDDTAVAAQPPAFAAADAAEQITGDATRLRWPRHRG